ncbi:hypothetical protein [Clostridium tyrobutyricum]|uniref:hypothetical protein n=1 Tax=Clostridium tyrobutyricum TaxID=1519 RepID=UPI001C386FFC|nr:hypothetical protein [Clostridium tyrobutyricum]MBV4417429.1 hypothetical protein [Clostridium tyrobutyricum]
MSKTDKELTVELAIAFINSWNSREHVNPINIDDTVEVFKKFYKAISTADLKSDN